MVCTSWFSWEKRTLFSGKKVNQSHTDKISLQTIDKICNYLEVAPEDFFDFCCKIVLDVLRLIIDK